MPDFDNLDQTEPEEPQDEGQERSWDDVALQPDGEHVGDFMERLAAIKEGPSAHLNEGPIEPFVPAEPGWQGPDIAGRLNYEFGQVVESHPERLEYAVTISAIPGDQGQPVAVALVVLAIPSAEIGQKIHTTLILQNLWPSVEEIREMVRQATESMLNFRSQAFAQTVQS